MMTIQAFTAMSCRRMSIMIGVLLVPALAVGADYDLPWHTIGGGGGMWCTGGDFELSGTIGQPDAGVAMAGGYYELVGGFWASPVAAPAWCLGDMDCSGGTPTFVDISYFVAALGNEQGWISYYTAQHGSEPPCPWLLGDYNGGGVEFTDIVPFANSIGQPCIGDGS